MSDHAQGAGIKARTDSRGAAKVGYHVMRAYPAEDLLRQVRASIADAGIQTHSDGLFDSVCSYFRDRSARCAGAPKTSRCRLATTGWLMIKLVYCFAKRPDLSLEEFSRYLRDVHGPIGIRIPGLRRLAQSVAIHDPRDAHEPSFDGMAELWFDGVEAVLRARESPEWQASTADERHFIDHSRTAYFLSHELTLPDPEPPV